jgi:hypothetical protein
MSNEHHDEHHLITTMGKYVAKHLGEFETNFGPTVSNCPLEIPLVLKGLRPNIPSILAIELSDSQCSQQPDFEDVGGIQQDASAEALRTAPRNFGKFLSSTGSTVAFPVDVSSSDFQTWLSPRSVAWIAPHLLPAEMTTKVFSASSPKCCWTWTSSRCC